MKKLITLMMAFAMTLSLAACGSKFVEPAKEDFDYQYNEEYEGVAITKYRGEAKAIRIPSELDGDPVTIIGGMTFGSSLTEVIIPDSVIEIGNLAFMNCNSLKKVTIPDSVTTIGSGAFSYCSNLTEITIPDSVTTIKGGVLGGAFSGCSNLKKITIPDSVTTIGGWAFSSCSSLKKITIPDSVATIGEGVFSGCTSLTSIKVPKGLDLSNAGLEDNVKIIYY